jgi:hypothetical protein
MKPPVHIESLIVSVREQKVILDADLAELYGAATKALNQAVKRNADRFPGDFVFQLTSAELKTLKSQNVTLKRGELILHYWEIGRDIIDPPSEPPLREKPKIGFIP